MEYILFILRGMCIHFLLLMFREPVGEVQKRMKKMKKMKKVVRKRGKSSPAR